MCMFFLQLLPRTHAALFYSKKQNWRNRRRDAAEAVVNEELSQNWANHIVDADLLAAFEKHRSALPTNVRKKLWCCKGNVVNLKDFRAF